MDRNADGDLPMAQRMPSRRLSISDNAFNKLILQPENVARTKPDKSLGNPTPIALVGFLLALSQMSCDLLGWQGTGGKTAAGTACYIFFGGLLQFVGGLLEWSLGHTFPSVVFCSFGAFYFSYGAGFIPAFATWASYAPDGQPPTAGMSTPEFNAGAGFFPLWMAVLCLIYMVLALRTNVCFVAVFFLLTLGSVFSATSNWLLAQDYDGNTAAARRMAISAGAVFFVAALIGWWVFASVMLVEVDFPIQIPIGDLSNIVRGRSEKRQPRGPLMQRPASKSGVVIDDAVC